MTALAVVDALRAFEAERAALAPHLARRCRASALTAGLKAETELPMVGTALYRANLKRLGMPAARPFGRKGTLRWRSGAGEIQVSCWRVSPVGGGSNSIKCA